VAQILGMTTDAHVVATLNPGLSMRTFDDAVVVARAQTASPPIGLARAGTHSGMSELPAMWSGPAMSTAQSALMARQAAESAGSGGPASSASFPAQGIPLRAQSSPSMIQPVVTIVPSVSDPGLPAAPPVVVVRRSALGMLGWIVLAAVLFGGVGSLLYIALGERNAVRASDAAALAGGSSKPAATRGDADPPAAATDLASTAPGSAASDPAPAGAPSRSDRDPAPPESTGSAGTGSAVEPSEASRKPGSDDKSRRPAPRPVTVRRQVAVVDDKDSKNASALIRQARAAESASKWEEARVAYQRLEKFRPYRSEAMYGQAWSAFQMNDARMAQQMAGQLATEGGPYRVKAMFLYADALFRQGESLRAKGIYQKLQSELHGDQRSMAQKKIVACNKELNLPANDGVN
jgi:hypothetical protein